MTNKSNIPGLHSAGIARVENKPMKIKKSRQYVLGIVEDRNITKST